MRQKYEISRDCEKNNLRIREYAIIDKEVKNSVLPVIQKVKYSLLGEETYDSEVIVKSITKGKDALIGTLRTHNLFPIASYAQEIAASVTEMYRTPEDHSAELVFNDVDLLSAEKLNMPADKNPAGA